MKTTLGRRGNLALTTCTDEPGIALPGGGAGEPYNSPMEKLSQLIVNLNDRYGMNLSEVDMVWFEQQKRAVRKAEKVASSPSTNDHDRYRVLLERIAEDAMVDRHKSNGQLFNAFFEKPGAREALMSYVPGSYDEIRDDHAS